MRLLDGEAAVITRKREKKKSAKKNVSARSALVSLRGFLLFAFSRENSCGAARSEFVG